MEGAGYLNLPDWQGKLQKILTGLQRQDLIRLPVLGKELVEHPWVALEEQDFFSAVQTGILFKADSNLQRLPPNLICADAQVALDRLSAGQYSSTFFKAAIGATFPIIKVLASAFETAHPQRIFTQNDGVAGFILSRMAAKETSLEKAIYEAQWEKVSTSNVNLSLHGIVTRNRLALQIAEIFSAIVPYEQINTVGIGSLDLQDVKIAASLNCCIRMLGMAEKEEGFMRAAVEPCMIPERFLLAQARGGSEILYAQNRKGLAQVYACPGTGCETMVRGILSDLHEPRETMTEPELVHTIKEFSDNFYIRISLMNMADTLSRVLQVFAGNSLDVESIMHPEFDVSHETEAGVSRTLLIITGPTCHTQIKKIAEQINQQVKLATVCSFFRYLR
jgi:hypothetical protein